VDVGAAGVGSTVAGVVAIVVGAGGAEVVLVNAGSVDAVDDDSLLEQPAPLNASTTSTTGMHAGTERSRKFTVAP
jgi:hypothetical protein